MKKRSKYRPKGVRLDNLSWIKAGFAKVGTLPKAGVDLKIKNHVAFDSLLTGSASRDHVDVMIAALNMAEALYRVAPELGKDYSEEIKAAQDAILTMSRRGIVKDRFLFTGPEIQAVRLGLEIHDAQLDACSVRQMEHALDLVTTVIQNKQARVIVEAA